jgi:hypothetical protein
MYQLAASCLVSLLFVMSVIAAALAPGKSLAQEENALVPGRPGSAGHSIGCAIWNFAG